MSTGQYVHVTKNAGTIVDAPLYNNAHQNQVNNDIPTSCGAWSDDVTEMRLTLDPAPAGVATPVADLGSEIEQLRFVIEDIKTALNSGTPPTFWYTPITPTATQIKGHGAHAIRATNQAIGTSYTAVTFTSTTYDTGVVLSSFDPFWSAGQPTRLTASVTGVYQILGYVAWAASTGSFSIAVVRNSTTILAATEQADPTGGSASWTEQVSTQYKLNQGDYIELQVRQNAGGTVNINRADFALELLAPSTVVAPVVSWTLTVTESGAGTGTVTSSPGAISVPGTASDMFVDGSTVVLTVTPTAGQFVMWTGADVPVGHETDNPLSITMNANKTVNAVISPVGVFDIADNGTAAANITAATRFFSLARNFTQGPTEATLRTLMPTGGTAIAIYARFAGTGVPASTTATIRLVLNGTVNNGIVVVGTGTLAANSVVFNTGTVTWAADDTLSIQVDVAGAGAVKMQSFGIKYLPAT